MTKTRVNELHDRALQASQSFRNAESELLDALIPIETELCFAHLGYSSLYDYSVRALGLSEGLAYNAISVVRKSIQVPQLLDKVREGRISISKAKKISSVLTPENHVLWLEMASSLTSRQLEKEVAKVNPKEATPERTRYVSGDRLCLSLGISESLLVKLQNAQSQASRTLRRPATLEDTLEEMVNFYLEKKDPQEKALRAQAKKPLSIPVGKQFPGTAAGRRTPIPSSIIHTVKIRDGNRCQFKGPDGTPCMNDRWTELHHKVPVSHGGEHSADNITSLCSTHHRLVHDS